MLRRQHELLFLRRDSGGTKLHFPARKRKSQKVGQKLGFIREKLTVLR